MYRLLFLILIIPFLIFCTKTPKGVSHSPCEFLGDTRKCPDLPGAVLLPRYFPLKSIFVGYAYDLTHLHFLEMLIEVIKGLENKPKLNILIPRLDEKRAYADLKQYFNSSDFEFINLIPVSATETVWVQDYFEIYYNTKTRKDVVQDLPYIGREGEDLPALVALSCKNELVEQANFDPQRLPGNGDYGGNIESLTEKILMIGNNISDETFYKVKELSVQEILEIDVEWLETGHVDELISTIPHKKDAKACEQSLLIASPAFAFDIIENRSKLETFKTQFKPFEMDEDKWRDLSHCLLKKSQSKKECMELKRANLAYEKIIQKNVGVLQKLMQEVHGCTLKEERIPQVFLPLKDLKVYGTVFDRAVSINPNSVNNIFIYPNILMPKQEFAPFQQEVDEIFKKYELKLIYVDGKFVHELNGGIHCAVNTVYGCNAKI